MTDRRKGVELRVLAIAAALAPIFLAGCATPYTHLEWGTQRPSQHASARHSEYRRYAEYRRDDYAAVPVPQARPTHSWWSGWSEPSRPTSDHYASGTGTFAWPVRGRVIEEFGESESGERNDGINIAASYGEPIRAAADGIVSYAGNELRSYGNLALVRHDSGYVTAYAHAEKFIVGKGDHVARGQVIGYVGATGDVHSPQLHFEVRHGARDPIDPRSMLVPLQVASRE